MDTHTQTEAHVEHWVGHAVRVAARPLMLAALETTQLPVSANVNWPV